MNSKYESISDDDLFGSGCDSLDLNSLISSDVSEPITGNAANTMTLQNQDESKNRSSNVKSQQQVCHRFIRSILLSVDNCIEHLYYYQYNVTPRQQEVEVYSH